MHPTLRSAVGWIRRRAENLVAALLAVMFVAFVVQIVFRYVFNYPVGWSSELSVIAWLYMVLIGSAFWLEDHEEIRFDLIAGAVPPAVGRVIAIAVAAATVVLFGMSLPATVKYVAFMKVESSSYLKIRLDVLYSVYVVFAVAVIARYAWAVWAALRGAAPGAADVTRKGYGL
jgi:TRAP-type C4-dicarboxylate transport system permease small subunit